MAEKMSNVSSEDIDMRSAGKQSNLETLYCFEKNIRYPFFEYFILDYTLYSFQETPMII